MRYKSLLLDVDGTLVPVGPFTVPSKRVVEAVRGIRDVVGVSLISGRPLDWLRETFEVLGLEKPCVINGGSQIIDPRTHKILWERPLSKMSLDRILRIIDGRDITSFTVNDDGVEHKNPKDHPISKPLAVQLSYFGSKEESDDCLAEILRIPDISAHKFYSWDKDRNYRQEVYITHAAANKQHAITELLRLEGVEPHETIAIGDSRNDMPMFEIAGLSVAMGNADNKLKAAADYVAPSVEEDGVAHAIEKFIVRGEQAPKRARGFLSRLFRH